MSRDGGLLAAFQPPLNENNTKIHTGYTKGEAVILNNKFVGVCVKSVAKNTSARQATAQVMGIVTVASASVATWKYHDAVYAKIVDGAGQFVLDPTDSIPIGFLLDVSEEKNLIRVQLDRSLQFTSN